MLQKKTKNPSNIWQTLLQKKTITILAPMEDVTDTVFRQMVTICGKPDLLFTEFVSVEGLCSAGRRKVIHRLQFTPMEKPLIAQLWGLQPKNYQQAATLVQKMGFAGIDINMGCPVAKVIKHGACSALINNPSLAAEIIKATKEGAPQLPISVKTRIGFRQVQTEEWCSWLLKQNLAALIIHGRIAKNMSSGLADWQEIAKVVSLRDQLAPKTVIIGNGDVQNLADLQSKVDKYKVDGVMVGRAIFQDIFFFNTKQHLDDLSITERLQLMIKHTNLFADTWEDRRNFEIIKKFYKMYVRDFPGATELRIRLMTQHTKEEIEETVEDFLAELPI